MAVIVDKAGSNSAALGVDRARSGAAQLADFDDLAVLDADIAAERRHSRAIDNQSVLDQQIIRHRFFLSAGWSLRATRRTRFEVYALRPWKQRRSNIYKPRSHVLSAGVPSTNARERSAS